MINNNLHPTRPRCSRIKVFDCRDNCGVDLIFDVLPYDRQGMAPGPGAARLLGSSPDRDHISLQGGLVKFLFVEQQQDERALADCVVRKIHGKGGKKSTRN